MRWQYKTVYTGKRSGMVYTDAWVFYSESEMIQTDAKRIEAIIACRGRIGLIECDEHSRQVE
jgi:hypothetical protein